MANKILVVDDDLTGLRLMSLTLKSEGFEVITATNGPDALVLAAEEAPDVILLDIMMPAMDGYEVCQRLRANSLTSHIPVVMLTAKTQVVDKIMGFKVGADDYIAKPVEPSEVVARTRAVLRRAERLRVSAVGTLRREITPRRSRGKLVVFFSPKGGVGTTSVCVNTAASLAELETGGVIVVDLVLPMGSVGPMVGLTHPSTIARLTSGGEEEFRTRRVDDYLITREKLGFHVLLAPSDPLEAQRVSPNLIEPLFAKLLPLADYVLVDVGRSLSRITLPVMARADQIVIVLASDKATLDLTRKCLEVFASLEIPPDRLVGVLNRAVGLHGLSREETEDYLGMRIMITVPYERDRFTLASNQGVPLVQKESSCPAALSIRRLAMQLKWR